MLGSPILYLKGMRILMFQLSGFYYRACGLRFVGYGAGVCRVQGLELRQFSIVPKYLKYVHSSK